MSFDLRSVNDKMMILLSVFIALNFFDAATTLVAIRAGPPLVELNPIAAGLFRMSLPGFALALALKYIPILPLGYATFLGGSETHPLAVRVVKFGVLVALAAADIFYALVVASNAVTLASFLQI